MFSFPGKRLPWQSDGGFQECSPRLVVAGDLTAIAEIKNEVVSRRKYFFEEEKIERSDARRWDDVIRCAPNWQGDVAGRIVIISGPELPSRELNEQQGLVFIRPVEIDIDQPDGGRIAVSNSPLHALPTSGERTRPDLFTWIAGLSCICHDR